MLQLQRVCSCTKFTERGILWVGNLDVLIVDGYNIIGAWDELVRLKRRSISDARDRLIEIMSEYKAYSGLRIIIVFDALYVKGLESKLAIDNLEIIYTNEKETADDCIERLVASVKHVKNQVYVATSDYAEQRTIFGRGALRISARELLINIEGVDHNIEHSIKKLPKYDSLLKSRIDYHTLKKLEKIRRRGK